MKQGEIWFADLNPVKGSEQAGLRPVVIVSGNLANAHLPIVICCPLTTKIKNYKGNVVLEANEQNGLAETSEILTFHIRSMSKERLIRKTGNISVEQVAAIKKCFDEIWRY